MKKLLLIVLLTVGLFLQKAMAQKREAFTLMPLGVKGGSDEGDLSAYLIAPHGEEAYVCLDAGTIYDGLRAARRHRFFKGDIARFLRHHIKGYLISHPHLDHVAGLVINSPEDSRKNIYALPFCIRTLKAKYFTWSAWANFANEGERPTLKKYTYKYLKAARETPIAHTSMSVTPFLLSHAVPGKSTAFLIRHQDNYFLYLGDTGDDKNEQSHRLLSLWQVVAPLVANKKLKGISIECSYPNEQPDNRLFGHLTPRLLMKNLSILDSLAGKNSMEAMPIIVAHIKPSGDNEETIRNQLRDENNLGVNLIFPKQGRRIKL